MKKLILAAVMLASASTAAMADDPWMMRSDHTCQIPQYSLVDFFRMISEYSSWHGLPQPQVDYTSGAKNGATIIHYTDPNTGNPGMIVIFGQSRIMRDVPPAHRGLGRGWPTGAAIAGRAPAGGERGAP